MRIHLRSYMHLQTWLLYIRKLVHDLRRLCRLTRDSHVRSTDSVTDYLRRLGHDLRRLCRLDPQEGRTWCRVWSTDPVTDYLRRLVHDLRHLYRLDPWEGHTWWPCLKHWSEYRLLTETGAWPSPSMPSGSSGGSHVMAVSEALIRLQMFFPTNTFTSLIIGLILRNLPCEESIKCIIGSS